jgi:SNF2 family DNA or RNA helicase
MSGAPYEVISELFELPHPADKLKPVQIDAINAEAPLVRGGYYAKVGTGKTAMSTVDALYQQHVGMADCHIVIVPPILVPQWVKWLNKIPGVKVVAYTGTPKARRLIDVRGAHFVVIALTIFKRDFAHIQDLFDGVNVGGLLDEATSIKNIESGNYRQVRQFFDGATPRRSLKLLTGTPCNTPADSYAYIKLIAPDCYRNKQVFDSVHIGGKDFFGSITSWENLPLLKKNMEIGTVRIEKRDVFPGLPVPIYNVIEYELDPEHYALYKELCEMQILELENGGKIDATSVTKLWQCSQQIIMNWDYFSGNPEKKSAGFDLVDQVLTEIVPEGKKLIIVANYKMTMAGLHRHLSKGLLIGKERVPLNPLLINSTVTPYQQEAAKEKFITDSACRVLELHPLSGGKGLDGLQHVCSEILFMEEPLSPIDFEQPVGRIDRIGQTETSNVRLAVAQNTIQVKLHQLVLRKDDLTTYVSGGWRSLRDAIYGKTP